MAKLSSSLRVSVLAASLGALNTGINLGILNPIMSFIAQDLYLVSYQVDAVIVALIVAATIGSLVAGPLADRFGLRHSQLLTALCFALGHTLSATAAGPAALTFMLTGRCLCGLACGSSTVLCPRHIAEISPPAIRGALATITQLSICTGILLAYLLGLPYDCSHPYDCAHSSVSFGPWHIGPWSMGPWLIHWWRIAVLSGVFTGIAQMLLLLASEESPAWLKLNGHTSAAHAASHRLWGAHAAGTTSTPASSAAAVGAALEAAGPTEPLPFEVPPHYHYPIEQPLLETPSLSQASAPSFPEAMRAVLRSPRHTYAAALALHVAVFQQLSGINTIIFFSSFILRRCGVASPILATVLVGLVNVGVSMVSAALVDHAGRRVLFGLSHAGCGLSLAALAATSFWPDWDGASIVAVAAMVTFVASFALGSGPIPFVYISEVLSDEIKGIVASGAMACNWGANVMITALFPVLLERCGLAVTFGLFCGFNAAAVAFAALFMVETKQMEMHEIQEALRERGHARLR